jgi:hypothetical protein
MQDEHSILEVPVKSSKYYQEKEEEQKEQQQQEEQPPERQELQQPRPYSRFATSDMDYTIPQNQYYQRNTSGVMRFFHHTQYKIDEKLMIDPIRGEMEAVGAAAGCW